MMRLLILTLSTLTLGLSAFAVPAAAQGLIWKLPETDGTWIRYEGTYNQIVRRPDASEGDLTLEWRRNIEIKSVGVKQAQFRGEMQACRWIEFKIETGKSVEGILDAGPGGIRMYKILVPESEVRGTLTAPTQDEGRTLFVSHIPFVEGYRKLGVEAEQKMESGVFQLYPTVSLIRHYRNLQSSGTAQPVNVPAGTFNSTAYQGSTVMETAVERSTNSCELYRSDETPFGVVKWTATTKKEQKGSVDPRSEFSESAIIREELQAVSIGENAESEFLVN